MKCIKFKFLYITRFGNIKESDLITWSCDCDIFLNKCNVKTFEDYLKDIPSMFERRKQYYRGTYFGYKIIDTRGFDNE